ncbi:MAG: FHA domain-containing protein [Acidimicrobiia bacterium]|nr:FHA domain-containing protein [Acidimicrobiia bacterium]
MPEQLLTILKLCLLALLYLFFLRVVRAVWVEVSGPRLRKEHQPVEPSEPDPRKSAKAAAKARKAAKGPVLVVVAPPEQQGHTFPLGEEITVGRAAGCQVTLEDSYVSQIHARVFARDGQIYVEDLGSTNGTYLNRRKVAGPMLVNRGDRVQVGSTVMELG